MILSAEQLERVEYLLTVFGDESINADEMVELNRFLIESEQARELYYADTCLCSQLQEGPLAKSVSQELRLQQPRQRRRHAPRSHKRAVRLWPFAAAVAAALCMFVLYSVDQNTVTPALQQIYVEEVFGTVTVGRADKVAIKANHHYPVGAHLYVSDGAHCLFAYNDGTRITLSDHSHLELIDTSKNTGNKLINMYNGQLHAVVSRQPPQKAFILLSPHAEVKVLGTEFNMQVAEKHTALQLHRGKIAFTDTARQQTSYLEAGQSITTTTPEMLPIQKQALAIYAFNEGSGTVIHDNSVSGKALNLTIHQPDHVQWLPGKGIKINGVAEIISDEPALKISQAIQKSNAFTILMVIKPSKMNPQSTKTGMDRIVTVSQDATHRNISVGMGEMEHDPSALSLRLRREQGGDQDDNGLRAIATAALPSLRALQATTVVISKSETDTLRFWVGGELVFSSNVQTDFSHWNAAYHLALAQEVEPSLKGRGQKQDLTDVEEQARAWAGTLYHIEIYDVALDETAMRQILNQVRNKN